MSIMDFLSLIENRERQERIAAKRAQAMSAGTAKTEGLGAKPASAVGPADAPTLPTGDHHG